MSQLKKPTWILLEISLHVYEQFLWNTTKHNFYVKEDHPNIYLLYYYYFFLKKKLNLYLLSSLFFFSRTSDELPQWLIIPNNSKQHI